MTSNVLTDYQNRPDPIYYCGKVRKGMWIKLFNEETGKIEEWHRSKFPYLMDEELVNILIKYKLLKEYE